MRHTIREYTRNGGYMALLLLPWVASVVAIGAIAFAWSNDRAAHGQETPLFVSGLISTALGSLIFFALACITGIFSGDKLVDDIRNGRRHAAGMEALRKLMHVAAVTCAGMRSLTPKAERSYDLVQILVSICGCMIVAGIYGYIAAFYTAKRHEKISIVMTPVEAKPR